MSICLLLLIIADLSGFLISAVLKSERRTQNASCKMQIKRMANGMDNGWMNDEGGHESLCCCVVDCQEHVFQNRTSYTSYVVAVMSPVFHFAAC